jgi:hypothetical protein
MRARVLLGLLLLLASITAAAAIVRDHPPGRFDHLIQQRRGGVVTAKGSPVADLPAHDPARQAWNRVATERGGQWRVWLDERSGLPTLVLVQGKSWLLERDAGSAPIGPDLEHFASMARRFLRESHAATGNFDGQIVLDREASGPRGPDAWQVLFAQVVDGVPVEGARFEFHVSHGNLVALGAQRWAPVGISTVPNLVEAEARYKLDTWVRWTDDDGIVDLAEPELVLVPLDADPSSRGAWRGPRGEGIAHRLIWRFRFTDAEAIATWTGEVDAHTGEIVAFYDDTRYDRIKGHVNPISDDGQCHIGGCPEPDYPMPYVGYTEDGGAVQYTNYFGHYACGSTGSTIETALSGRYFWINDQCGPILESTTCANELDLGAAEDNSCTVAPGASAGNTDAARSAYYTLNAVARKARFWIPGNAWLDTSVQCRTNVGGTCNASWGGGIINMYGPGGGCGNTGQLQGLVAHEWGHGMNDFDGGGSDNPSEAYSDITAIFEARESCIARGFGTTSNCDGYGDTCLSCTGLREMDWDARATPAAGRAARRSIARATWPPRRSSTWRPATSPPWGSTPTPRGSSPSACGTSRGRAPGVTPTTAPCPTPTAAPPEAGTTSFASRTTTTATSTTARRTPRRSSPPSTDTTSPAVTPETGPTRIDRRARRWTPRSSPSRPRPTRWSSTGTR